MSFVIAFAGRPDAIAQHFEAAHDGAMALGARETELRDIRKAMDFTMDLAARHGAIRGHVFISHSRQESGDLSSLESLAFICTKEVPMR